MTNTWKIGDIEIKNRVVVAPMAGISNAAFRVTVKEAGAGLVVCEMISDQGIHFRNKKTLDMLYIDEREYPLSVQIFGGNKDSLVEAAQFVEANTKAAIIDINMGCPVNKVIKAEAGAEDVFAQKAYLSCLSDGVVQSFNCERVFGSYIYVAFAGSRSIACDHHAFQHLVRVALHDASVHKCARVAFVSVTYNVLDR